MQTVADQFLDEMKNNVDSMLVSSFGVKKLNPVQTETEDMCLHYPFQLPITYIKKDELHELPQNVVDDLELEKGVGETSVYESLFQPEHVLGQNLVENWKTYFTSNRQYILDTQDVIQETDCDISFFKAHHIQDSELLEIWKDLKVQHSQFLEKYCYIEWDIVESLNQSSYFLQIMSVLNMMSPVISLLMPLLFFIFPFIILKMRSIPITFDVYISVLQDIAKYHFIGKTISNLSKISPEKILYVLLGLCMFCYQIYQNIISCKRFYKNIQKICGQLMTLKVYLGHTIKSMDEFLFKHSDKSSYKPFCEDIIQHKFELERALGGLHKHQSRNFTLMNLSSVGYVLKNYYEFHANGDFDTSLRYSFGFHGFLDNIRGLRHHMKNGKLSCVNIDNETHSAFHGQYYPLHDHKTCVRNDCHLEKNMIITGPNASGKTTFLKTTSINVICSQQMGVGFFKKGLLRPYTHIHSYLNIPDTSQRDSLFQAESRRCKDILDIVHGTVSKKSRHFGIFDELYSGTNPEEATKSGYAFMKYLSKFSNVDFILTTHYNKICEKLKKHKNIQNYKMNVIEKDDSFIFSYKIKKGISKVHGALKILEDMEYPDEIIQDVVSFHNRKNKVIKDAE